MASQLIITGDLEEDGEHSPGAELWRVPFQGWGVRHVLPASALCRPRRYVVIDDRGFAVSAGYTNDPVLLPGERFTIQLSEPPPPF